MPCKTEEPDHNHVATQRAAKLYLYVLAYFNPFDRPQWVVDLVSNPYAQDDRIIPLLCKTLKDLPRGTFENLVYNARSRESRDLADWWEEHQEADKRRKEAIKRHLAAAATPARAHVDQRLVEAPDRLRSIAGMVNIPGIIHQELHQIADLIEHHLAKR